MVDLPLRMWRSGAASQKRIGKRAFQKLRLPQAGTPRGTNDQAWRNRDTYKKYELGRSIPSIKTPLIKELYSRKIPHTDEWKHIRKRNE